MLDKYKLLNMSSSENKDIIIIIIITLTTYLIIHFMHRRHENEPIVASHYFREIRLA